MNVPQHLLKNKLVVMSKFCLLSLNNQIRVTLGKSSSKQFQKMKEYYTLRLPFTVENFTKDQEPLYKPK
jgi:hypothetical protein